MSPTTTPMTNFQNNGSLLKNKTGINLIMINAFIYISMSLYTPYLSSYYSKAGISAIQIGLLLTIGPLVAIFIQPVWATISDSSGRRKRILSLVIIGSAFSMFSYYIGNTFITFLFASFLLSLFATSIIPLSDAIILRSAKVNHLDFSKIRMGGTIGYAIMVNLSGTIVKHHPAWQFAMGFAGYIILLLFVQSLPKEEKAEINLEVIQKKPKVAMKDRINILSIFESKQIYFLLALAFVSQVGISFFYTFLGVYMIKLGFNEGPIGFINCVAALSEIPVLFFINRILKKTSTMKITVIACFLLGVRIFAISGENIIFMILAQLLHGLTYMAIYYSCAVFISNHVKPENQSKGQSVLAIVQIGLGSIVGNILGGYLVDSMGLKNAYRTMSLLVIIASAIIITTLIIYRKTSNSKETFQ